MGYTELILTLLVCAGFLWLWWKVFKKVIFQQKLALQHLDKEIELSIREKGVVGSLRSKKLLVLAFWAIVIVGLMTIFGRLFESLLQ